MAIHSSGQTIFSLTYIEEISLGPGEEVDEVAGGASGMGVDGIGRRNRTGCRCNQCDSFYVGKTRNSLSIRMNGHRSSSISPDNLPLPVAIHTKSHQLHINSC